MRSLLSVRLHRKHIPALGAEENVNKPMAHTRLAPAPVVDVTVGRKEVVFMTAIDRLIAIERVEAKP